MNVAYFHEVLFVLPLYKVVLTFELVDEIVKCRHSMKPVHFPEVLFVLLYKVFETSQCVGKIRSVTAESCVLS